MSKIFMRAAAAAAIAAAMATPAQAVLTTNAGDVAPASVIDFEAFDGFETIGPEMLDASVTFTGDTGSMLGAFIADLGTNGTWGAGNKFASTGTIGELRFTFANGQSVMKAGALVNHVAAAAFPFAMVVSAYGQSNQIIETHTFMIGTAEDSLNAGSFVGIVRPTADIRSLSFKGFGVVVDDFAYTAPVPEAGTWAMMLAGLLSLGFVAMRQRKV